MLLFVSHLCKLHKWSQPGIKPGIFRYHRQLGAKDLPGIKKYSLKFSLCCWKYILLAHIRHKRFVANKELSTLLMTWYRKTLSLIRFFFYISISFYCSLVVCLSVCQLTRFHLYDCTYFDAVFAKWLLTTLAQNQLKLVTLGQKTFWDKRSKWQSDGVTNWL